MTAPPAARLRRLAVAIAALAFGAGAAFAPDGCAPPVAHAWPPPLDRRVAIPARDVALRAALEQVARAAQIHLSYSAELVPLEKHVCAGSGTAPAGDVLTALLEGTQLRPVVAAADQVALTPWRALSQGRATPHVLDSATVLDRVVVTGNVTAEPARDLAVAVDVLGGRDLERRQATTLSQALDGAVPGLWMWEQSPTSLLASYGSLRGASSFGVTVPKIYIDGIEVANPLLLAQFVPETIDRIEVIRGPQGAALYGSDAISGVINIVTTQGVESNGPRSAVRSNFGVGQTGYASGSPFAQSHAATFAAGTPLRSVNLALGLSTSGDYLPGAAAKQFSARGVARFIGDRTSLVVTGRFFGEDAGIARNPILANAVAAAKGASTRGAVRDATGVPQGEARDSTIGIPVDSGAPQTVRQYTVGATATFAQNERWTHTLVVGVDGYRLNNVVSDVGAIPTAADSALLAAAGGADRATVRLSTVAHVTPAAGTAMTLTLAAEHATLRDETRWTLGAAPAGTAAAAVQTPIVRWQHNTGLIEQATATFHDAFTLTEGLRFEQNDAFADPTQWRLLPMAGAAYVQTFGGATLKWRAAYGKGVRTPRALERGASSGTVSSAASATLAPEEQAGTEAGFDLVIGRAFTLQATRFDQRASGIVQQVATLHQGANGAAGTMESAGPRFSYELQNIGEIGNAGWELEAAWTVRQLRVAGTLSTVDSRVQRVAANYAGDLQVGDRVLGVPARTASVDVSWTAPLWTASVTTTGAQDWVNYSRLAIAQALLDGRHQQREFLGAQLRSFWRHYDGASHVRASLSRQLFPGVSMLLGVENLLNVQTGEPDDLTIVPGRTVSFGFKARF